MVDSGVSKLCAAADAKNAWLKLLTTNDVIGIKVYSAPGRYAGTRPEVALAVALSLVDAGIPKEKIIVWDKRLADLEQAGYVRLFKDYGITTAGAVEFGYDEEVFYDKPLIGNLTYGDLEFGKKGEGVGRRSYVTKLLTKKITKIISIAPMLNHYSAGVCGNLYSLAFGSVDNTLRFESSVDRLNEAVTEIFALTNIYDRCALYITDALICQYEGSNRAFLHYATVLGQLRFSFDPVALDVLSIEELNHQRQSGGFKPQKPNLELYNNASILELGVSDTSKIKILKAVE